MGVRLARMSTHTVVLFALFALSLAPAADASCSGIKTNNAKFCQGSTCTAGAPDNCATWSPNTCAAYQGQYNNIYVCTASQTYNTANDATTLALGTTVAQFQAACCVTTSTTCAAFTGCTAGTHYLNTANSLLTTLDVATCCTAYPKCGTYACSSGYTTIPANANNYVGTASPTTSQGDQTTSGTSTTCCTQNANTCQTYQGCTAGTYYLNTASPLYYLNTAGTTLDVATCCTAYTKCAAYTTGGTTIPAYACSAGYTTITANANNYVGTVPASTTASQGDQTTGGTSTTCCTANTLTCMAYAAAGTYSCPTTWATNAASVTTISAADICYNTYLTTCCTPKKSCWANRADYTVPTAQRIVANGVCNTADGVCTDITCCSSALNTCQNPATAGMVCAANTYLSPNTVGSTAPCTLAPYQAACCIASPQCSSYTCANGYQANPAAASIFCTAGVCGTTQCCTPISGACLSHTCTDAVTKTLNTATLSTVGNTDAVCCIDRTLCTSVTCYAGITTGKNAQVYGSTSEVCCTTDTTKCYGSTFSCPTGYFSIQGSATSSNAGLSAATQDLHNTNCCALQSTCPAYWEATGTSSAGALRPALVTLVLGAIAGLLM